MGSNGEKSNIAIAILDPKAWFFWLWRRGNTNALNDDKLFDKLTYK